MINKIVVTLENKKVKEETVLKKFKIKLSTLKTHIRHFNKTSELRRIKKKNGILWLEYYKRGKSGGATARKIRKNKELNETIEEVSKINPIEDLFKSVPEDIKKMKLFGNFLTPEERLIVLLGEYKLIKKQIKQALKEIDDSLNLSI